MSVIYLGNRERTSKLVGELNHVVDSRYLYEGNRYNACCFFCQQAAEKALKAYLYRQGAEHIYGHSVAELCHEASMLDRDFADIKNAVSPLDVYYIQTRHPNAARQHPFRSLFI